MSVNFHLGIFKLSGTHLYLNKFGLSGTHLNMVFTTCTDYLPGILGTRSKIAVSHQITRDSSQSIFVSEKTSQVFVVSLSIFNKVVFVVLIAFMQCKPSHQELERDVLTEHTNCEIPHLIIAKVYCTVLLPTVPTKPEIW